MAILLYPPDAQQDAGFYRYLFDALRTCAGARDAKDPRPTPRMTQPYRHESAWIEYEGVRVLVDMSDHIFLFDLPALRQCDLYLKANLNERVARRVLDANGMGAEYAKLRPYLFLPPTLDRCRRLRKLAAPVRFFPRPFDVCHIVGVYRNPFLEGDPAEAEQGVPADAVATHFWVRYQVQRTIRESGLRGMLRLTSRCNPAIEDPRGIVRPNVSNERFLLSMIASRLCVVNTLPHAVFPWKVLESVMLEVPFVVERAPLITMPEDFALIPGRHYLELLPELPDFEDLPVTDIRSCRLAPAIPLERLRERARWLRSQVRDRRVMAGLEDAVRDYARNTLRPQNIVAHLDRLVRERREGRAPGAVA